MSDKSKSNTESRSDNSEYKEEKPVKNKGEKERENHYESENILLNITIDHQLSIYTLTPTIIRSKLCRSSP